jgi:type VI secretion system protein ImpG
MDPRLLFHYNRELQHVREMGAEFARDYPKVAGRLGMNALECADPYVERLLEGFAFMAARVQVELEGQQPGFAQHLLEMLYPHYLAPVPSMAVVQFTPDEGDDLGADGHVIPARTAMHSLTGPADKTVCEYTTGHEVTLWPLQVTEATYLASPAALAAIDAPPRPEARAGIRIRFAATAGIVLNMLSLDALPLYLAGGDGVAGLLYEQLHGNALGFALCATDAAGNRISVRHGTERIGAPGFAEEQHLLPAIGRSFSGYRLLQEYFACPERFLFVQFEGLRSLLARSAGREMELVIWLDRSVERLNAAVSADNFRLYCTPAINLFPRRGDRIHLAPGVTEYHVLADRTRPMDFEVHSVAEVEGYGDAQEPMQRFEPFYGNAPRSWHRPGAAFYTVRRVPRRLSTTQKRGGARSSYIGNELFLSLVDGAQAPYSHALRQLGMQLLCSNRDLPLHMPVGVSTTDFILDRGGPVRSIRCLAGPTRPHPAAGAGQHRWRLLSHLQLNYLSLIDQGEDGAVALREMLTLYHDPHDAGAARLVEGLRKVSSRAITRRLPIPGPATYGRGLEITLTCDDNAYEGQGAFLLASVLRHLFTRQASLNSFNETVLRTLERNEVARWPALLGSRPIL